MIKHIGKLIAVRGGVAIVDWSIVGNGADPVATLTPNRPDTGIFTDNAEIQVEGTGKMVSADELDTLLKDIEKLTTEN